MNYVGIDLHKRIIVLCVVNEKRQVVARRKWACDQVDLMREYFTQLGPFAAVIEATASYEWLWQLLEPLARRLVLAHPKKLRVIAESTRKSDRIDAQVLAEFLALDMIPAAYRPTPRQREHRVLVRHRQAVQQRITGLKNRLRHVLGNYNADRADLFSAAGGEYLRGLKLSAADRFLADDLTEELKQQSQRLGEANHCLKEFAAKAPPAEAEARAVLATIPLIGPVTIDVVLSELGDPRRFRSQKKAVTYAGLAPGRRGSADKFHDLGIVKEGSRLLRWALVEAAWRLVGKTRHWGSLYERLKARCGAKKAIVAVARRLLCVMISMLHRGEAYRLSSADRAA
jgi:transposase